MIKIIERTIKELEQKIEQATKQLKECEWITISTKAVEIDQLKAKLELAKEFKWYYEMEQENKTQE